jgi:hypothetical protein
MSEADECLMAGEAAAFLNVSTKTLLRAARRRQLPASEVGCSWVVARGGVVQFSGERKPAK